MLIWVEDNDLSFWEKADNGRDIFAYLCFAAQNERDLVDLYEFAVAHGSVIDWPEYETMKQKVEKTRSAGGQAETENAVGTDASNDQME